MAVFTGNGAAATPSFTFSSDTNTGVFRPSADALAITTSGVQRAVFDSSGGFHLGSAGGIPIRVANVSLTPTFSTAGLTGQQSSFVQACATGVNSTSAFHYFAKFPSGIINNNTVPAQDNETLGIITWSASDGAEQTQAAVIYAQVDGTPGIDSMPGSLHFGTTSPGSFAVSERMRIDSQGRMGFNSVFLGGGSGYYRFNGEVSGAASSSGLLITMQADSTAVTNAVLTQVIGSTAGNGGVPYTIAQLTYHNATQGAFHADSTVTAQYGFAVGSTFVGADNNYGFISNIPSGTDRYNFFAGGTAPNFFEGDVRTDSTFIQATVPTTSNITATASASSLIAGIRIGTPAANINLQVPTGTDLDAAFQNLEGEDTFQWSVINLAASGSGWVITVTAHTNHTLVGNMAVINDSSARFATRKTATNTFVSYRIS
jgi:hypothetical protein